MTISSVTKMWSRTTSSFSSEDLKEFGLSFTESYQVVHTIDTTEIEILLDASIPQVGQSYVGTGYSLEFVRVRDRSVEKVGPIFSIVTVTYRGSVGGTSLTDSPLNQPPAITWRAIRSTEPVDIDGYGFPYTNTNGELVDGNTKDIVDFELVVQRNFAFFATYAQREYLDSVNSDFFGRPGDLWPPGTVALLDFELQEIGESDLMYHSVTCKFGFRVPYNTVPLRAWWARYRNEGYYERTGVTVTFSGGGGTGAAGYAVSNPAGEISLIVVTSRGRGYTSAPTVTITATSGGGSGATATATVANQQVTSVSIGSGGSGYKSKLVRAVDDHGEPVTSPVLLKANGQRETNAANAFWIERPKKTYTLPYFSLGML